MARERVSDREFISADGALVDRMNDAGGGRYTLLKNGKAFDYVHGENEHLDRMLAIFGFHTKVGNVANTVLNDKDEPGSVDDAASEIETFLKSASEGVWREVSEGVARGPKYDRDVLASSLFEVLGAKAKGSVLDYRQRLEDKSYFAKVRANLDVMASYAAAMAARGKAAPQTTDALA